MTTPEAIVRSVRMLCILALVLQALSFLYPLLQAAIFFEIQRNAKVQPERPSIEIIPEFRAEPRLRGEKL